MDIMNLAAKISLDSKGFESSLRDSESKFKSFGDGISSWAVAKGQLIADFAKQAASAVGNFVKGSVTEGMSFDVAMSQVAATMGKTVGELTEQVGTAQYKVNGELKEFSGNLEDFARFMGANTKYTATEAAQALNYMALAGYTVQESMDMLPNVLNLASAGAMDLAKASDMITDTQTAFGISAERTTQMVDEMAKAASTGNTSVSQLGDAFLVVGALAQDLSGGFTTLADGSQVETDNIQEMTIALTAMANAGIKGSEAGTHLRNMILKLGDPLDAGTKALDEMGVKVYDNGGNMRALSDIFGDLSSKFKTMTKEAKLSTIGDLFNVRDTASVEALLNSIENGDWDKIGAALMDAEGAAQKMADVQLDNLKGDTEKWKSALSDVKIEISKKLTPTLRKFVGFGTESMQEFGEAIKQGGLAGGLETLGQILREKFPKLFKEIAPKIKNSFKTVFKSAKTGLANVLGLDSGDEATWGEIASQAFKKLKTALANAGGKAKVKIANWLGMTDETGGVIDDPSDTSWTEIAKAAYERVKEAFSDLSSKAKIQVAEWLGIEDTDTATWGTIAQKVTENIKLKLAEYKIKIADLLGIEAPEEATWSDIASKIASNIKNKLSEFKIKIADLLGVEKAEEATWGTIASDISQRIRGKLSEYKIKIADYIGVEDSETASWKSIAEEAFGKLKTKFIAAAKKAKVKIANWLGLTDESGNAIDDASDTSWDKIAEKMKDKLKGGFDKLKVKLSDLLGIDPKTVGEEVSWEDIGKEILNKLTSYFSHKGDFLAKLILGDEFETAGENKWQAVGQKISGWLSEAFKEGGLIDALLQTGTDKAAALAEFAGTIITNIATWVGKNVDKIMPVIQAIIGAITRAAPQIVGALVSILKDPKLWIAIGDMIKGIWQAVFGTPESNLNSNLFSGFGENGVKGAEAIQKYIDAYNQKNRDLNKLLDMEMQGDTASEEYKALTASVEEADKQVNQLYEDMMKVTDENGKNLFSSYMTWIYEHGYNGSGDLPDFPVELMPDDTKVREVTDAGYQAIVKLIPDTSSMPDDYNADGSFAKGDWSIPYDNFVANLHRGEMVLTASQARAYRDGNGGGFDISGIKEQIVSAIRSGMENATVRSYLNGKDITDEVNRNNIQAVKARRFAT